MGNDVDLGKGVYVVLFDSVLVKDLCSRYPDKTFLEALFCHGLVKNGSFHG